MVAIGGGYSATAVTLSPGGLSLTASGADLILSFPTTSPNYYLIQSSPDLNCWTNTQFGIPGDGTQKSVTMTNAASGSQGFYRYVAQKSIILTVPGSTAFGILGYWCGGITEQVTAGFDVTNGYATGVVALSTTCSGSGRGSRPTTHKASAAVIWDFTGNVVSAIRLTNGVSVGPTVPTDGLGDVIYQVGTKMYLTVPIPGAPTDVTAVQSGDSFQISWTPNVINPATLVSSTVTATPINSAAPVLGTGVSGSVSDAVIPNLQPDTAYQISVVSATIGGTSPASAPITVTTSPATVPPGAPTGVAASWLIPDPSDTNDTIDVTWAAADPGNSPVDQYLVTISGSDGAGTFTQTVSGTTLTAEFPVNDVPNWSVTVQAHNAAGWGPVSAVFSLGGL